MHPRCTLCSCSVSPCNSLWVLSDYSLCALCAHSVHALCTLCARSVHPLCMLCAHSVHSLCVLCASTKRAFREHSKAFKSTKRAFTEQFENTQKHSEFYFVKSQEWGYVLLSNKSRMVLCYVFLCKNWPMGLYFTLKKVKNVFLCKKLRMGLCFSV